MSDRRGIERNDGTTEDADDTETEDAMWPAQPVHEELTGVVRQAVKSLADEHVAQVLNYLKVTGARAGLLVNLVAQTPELRRFVLDLHPSVSSVSSVVRPLVSG